MIVVWKDAWCDVVFSSIDSKNLNICVKNSYKIKYSDDIENLLKIICNNPTFSNLKLLVTNEHCRVCCESGKRIIFFINSEFLKLEQEAQI